MYGWLWLVHFRLWLVHNGSEFYLHTRLKQEFYSPTDLALYIYSAKEFFLSKYERWAKMLLQPKDSCHQRRKQKKENHDWLQNHTKKLFAEVGWIPKEKRTLIWTNFYASANISCKINFIFVCGFFSPFLGFASKSLSQEISKANLVFFSNWDPNTNQNYFLLTSDPKKVHRFLFSARILQKGKEVSSERNFCISWPGGFRLMRWYEKLLVGPFSSCFTLFCLFKLFIFNEYFRVWANIFLGCVPFVCWSTFFLKIFIFSWAAKIFLCFSFCMFATSAYSFWDILYFSFVLSENPYLLVNTTPALILGMIWFL